MFTAGSRIILVSCLCLIFPLIANADIKPEIVVPYENGRSTFTSLSFDGRWLRRTVSERKGRITSLKHRFFDLRESPPHPKPWINGISTDSGWTGRWYVNSLNGKYQIWDLHGALEGPSLELSNAGRQDAGYVSPPRANEAESCLVSVYRSQDGILKLHLWYLNDPSLRADGYHDLGTITKGGRWPFVFTPNHGVLSTRDEALVRWNLLKPDEPPYIFDLGKGGNANHWWQAAGFPQTPKRFPYIETPYMSWSTENGNNFFTDFPMNPDNPSRWALPGDPLSFRGKNRILVIHDEHFWICDFDGASVSQPRKLGSTEIPGTSNLKLAGFGMGFGSQASLLGDSNYVRITNKKIVLPRRGLVQTFLVSTLSPETNRVIVEDLQGSSVEAEQFYTAQNSTGFWFVVCKGNQQKIWDLRANTIGEGERLDGLENEYLSHQIVGDRWMILADVDGGLYCLDLDSPHLPKARKFFQLRSKPKKYIRVTNSATRFSVEDPCAECTYIWNLAQLED